jgi:hypothetical protein
MMQNFLYLVQSQVRTAPFEACDVQYATPPVNQKHSSRNDEKIIESIQSLFTHCHFQTAILFEFFKPNINTLLPPSNYVAKYHIQAPFVRMPLMNTSLCFGISIFHVKLPDSFAKSQLSPEQMNRFRHVMNALIPDRSPNPPHIDSQVNGGWVESLGDGGSIGLSYSQTGKIVWSIVVRSGLDRGTLEELYAKLEEFEQEKKPVIEVCQFMLKIERLAEANRKRLAWLMCKILDLTPITPTGTRAAETACLSYDVLDHSENDSESSMMNERVIEPSHDDIQQCLAWIQFNHIPAWYIMPSRAPAAAASATRTTTLEQKTDFPAHMAGFQLGTHIRHMDDTDTHITFKQNMIANACMIEPKYEESTVWNVMRSDNTMNVTYYNECTPTTTNIVVDSDPTETLHILRTDTSMYSVLSQGSAYLNAYPNVGALNGPCLEQDSVISHFWLDGEVKQNINVQQRIVPTLRPSPGQSAYITPVIWRHSMFDPLGRVYYRESMINGNTTGISGSSGSESSLLFTCWDDADERYTPVA